MHLLILGLLVGGLAGGVAEAGKPASGPELLVGTGGFVEERMFGSSDVLAAVQAAYADQPAVADSVPMDGVGFVSLVRGIEVDSDGAIYAIFHAGDTSSSNTFSGILRYEEDENGASFDVLTAAAWDYEDASQETAEGAHIWSMDWIPDQEGGLVVTRWVDDDTTSAFADGRLEIVLFQPDASGALVEQHVLRRFDGVDDLAGGRVAADGLGNLYMWIQGQSDTGGELTKGLYRFYDAGNGDYSLQQQVVFPFAIEPEFEVDAAGNLFVQGRRGGTDAGVIFELAAGGDPTTDATTYATFTEDGSTESFTTWTLDSGTFAIAMSDLNGADQDYVGLVDAGVDVTYSDRVADVAPRGVTALSADGLGSVYVLHADMTQVSRRGYAVDEYAVYRLYPDLAGGGDTGDGGGGGGGNGGGKGKNK